MLKSSTVLLLLLSMTSASTAKQEFVDATYLAFDVVSDGLDCSINGKVDDSGNIDGSEHCKTRHVTHYKIALNGSIYTLRKTLNHPNRSLLTLGYASLLDNDGVLSAALDAGTPLKVKFTKKRDAILVKIGTRESRYLIIPGTVKQ